MADTTPYDVVSGEAIPVKMPYAGLNQFYGLDNTLKAGNVSKADLVSGYCSYGKSTGETS